MILAKFTCSTNVGEVLVALVLHCCAVLCVCFSSLTCNHKMGKLTLVNQCCREWTIDRIYMISSLILEIVYIDIVYSFILDCISDLGKNSTLFIFCILRDTNLGSAPKKKKKKASQFKSEMCPENIIH